MRIITVKIDEFLYEQLQLHSIRYLQEMEGEKA